MFVDDFSFLDVVPVEFLVLILAEYFIDDVLPHEYLIVGVGV